MQIVNGKEPGKLSIGQVTAATGVSKSTLRHWEKEFRDFLDVARTDGNRRYFTPDAIQKVEHIRHLVEEQGLTLRGVRAQLEAMTQEPTQERAPPPPVSEEKARKLADLVTDNLIRRLFNSNK
jgi:DNA-binding transcriptional MerR regulator